MCALATALLAAALLACVLPGALGAVAPARPSALARPKSWQEAWAALSPYGLPTVVAAACNSSRPTVAASCGEAAIQELWRQWKIKYKLNYATAVNNLRYTYFRTTVRGLVARLQTCPRSVWLGLNYRADWSPNELRLNRKLFVPKIKPSVPLKNVTLPSRWDWSSRAEDKVTPAKDQGRCGSCFAFAAVAAVESKLLIQYGKKYSSYAIDLSEQQMVDCVVPGQGSYLSSGCGGGYLEEPLVYTANRFMVKEDVYPYTSGDTNVGGACDRARTADVSEEDKVQLTGGGFNQLQQWSATALRQAVREAPVMVGFYIPDGSLFEFFSGGVWPASSCPLPPGAPNASLAQVNHALLVVGYDMTIPGNHHWIVKNSYGGGEEWGENGFGRIAMMPEGSYGACFMYYYMVAPTELVPNNLPVVPEPARTSLRLVNRNRAVTTAGRLEVYHNRQWGTVCSDGFGSAAATVVCQQLGLGNFGTAVPNAFYGEGTGPLWLDEVSCLGDEERLEVCAHAGWGVTNCGHKEDVGVSCRTEQVTARLVDAVAATGRWSGRLELLNRGAWASVCASGFNAAAATVVCRQLGLGTSGTVLAGNTFGEGSGTSRLANISCTGVESGWRDCRSAVWASQPCNGAGDAAMTCNANAASVRLVSGSISTLNSRLTQGRLEVLVGSGVWSTVCDDGFTDGAATVVCRQLGLSSTGFAMPGGSFGQGKGAITWDNVACRGTEATIQQCSRAAATKVDCTHREDVGVICSDTDPRVKPAVPVRLVGGSRTAGRLLVQYGGVWGTVCDDYFDDAAATVVCRQLGFTGRGVALPSDTYGPGSGPILLDNVECVGNETSLDDCKHPGWGVNNCQHSEDVGVECFKEPFEVRLTNRAAQMGHLQVRVNGVWGDVCAGGFDHRMAQVACRQLRLPQPALQIPGVMLARASGPLVLGGVDCQGSEARLDSCTSIKRGTFGCSMTDTVDVACNATVTLRLANSTDGTSGRLEVAVNGLWGRVLQPPGFDNRVAEVACRQMGLPTPGRVLPGGSFGPGTGPVIISRAQDCTGNEARLQDCPSNPWGSIVWGVRNEPDRQFPSAAIQCDTENAKNIMRLVGRDGREGQAGRLEFRAPNSQQWGTVCDRWANFDTKEAEVICRQMELPTPARSVGGSYFGAGTGPTLVSASEYAWNGCQGNEETWDQCFYSQMGQIDPACNAKTQVGIECGVKPLQVRLANMSADGLMGRPELLWRGQWGTICCGDRFCFSNDGSVADRLCDTLQLPRPGRLVDGSLFGRGIGPVLLDKAYCRWSDYSFDECSFSINTAKCTHAQDVGLECAAPPIDVRLVGGVRGRSGRVELFIAGRWGMACNKGGHNQTFTNREATVVCRQLGLALPGRVVRNGAFGLGSGPVFTSDLQCSGEEEEIGACLHGFYGNSLGCSPAEAAAIECGYKPPAMTLRLADGVPGQSGRLEVLHNGQWGTVEVNSQPTPTRASMLLGWSWPSFNERAATVVCRHLNLSTPGQVVPDATSVFGEAKGPVWLRRVNCVGDETRLEHCSHDPLSAGFRGEDVGIVCNGGSLPNRRTAAAG